LEVSKIEMLTNGRWLIPHSRIYAPQRRNTNVRLGGFMSGYAGQGVVTSSPVMVRYELEIVHD